MPMFRESVDVCVLVQDRTGPLGVAAWFKIKLMKNPPNWLF